MGLSFKDMELGFSLKSGGLIEDVLTPLLEALSGDVEAGVFDLTQSTGIGVGDFTCPNLVVGGLPLTQTFGNTQDPVPAGELGANFAGANKHAEFSVTLQPTDYSVFLAMTKDPEDNAGFIMGDSAQGRFSQGSTWSPAGNFQVDGVTYASLGERHDALDDGAEHIVSFPTLTINSGPVRIGRSSGSWEGYLRRAVIYRPDAVSDTTVARLAAEAFLQV